MTETDLFLLLAALHPQHWYYQKHYIICMPYIFKIFYILWSSLTMLTVSKWCLPPACVTVCTDDWSKFFKAVELSCKSSLVINLIQIKLELNSSKSLNSSHSQRLRLKLIFLLLKPSTWNSYNIGVFYFLLSSTSFFFLKNWQCFKFSLMPQGGARD